jgi:leader peptidase (prepilin peptidase)/N-methyltransferase
MVMVMVMATAVATVTTASARTTAEAVVAAVANGGLGIAAGAAARRLLARMQRGTRVRAPVCELATGSLWAVIGGLWGAGRLPSAWLPALLGLAWLGVAAGLVDVRHRRLPDTLTAAAACLAPLSLLPLGIGAAGRGLLGALVAVAGYGLVHLLRPVALGLGDVKLAAPLGAVLGAASWAALAIAAVLAAVLTGVVGLLLVCAGRAPPGAVVPHGPSMLVAAWLVTLATAAGGG